MSPRAREYRSLQAGRANEVHFALFSAREQALINERAWS